MGYMARLNGKEVDFRHLTLEQVGERLLEASPSGDGKGVIYELSESEDNGFIFIALFTHLTIGDCIVNLIADTVEKKTGNRPEVLAYNYDDNNQTFVS